MTGKSLPKRYHPRTVEPRLHADWQEAGLYDFDRESDAPVYSIDTPPPTVSGNLHLGHVYSYSHTDFVARFWRMNGYNVFYPMGFDDNGLPTERLVERREGIRPEEVDRATFIAMCLAVAEEAGADYRALWERLGLSIDWRYSYHTNGELARRTSQRSFIDLYRQGLVYRRRAPTLWCPECRTAIAQADLNDLQRASTFYTLTFELDDGRPLEIATTRPELLPACVAIFVHPEDARYTGHVGGEARVPLFGQRVPILADAGADPEKGTGAVMCCTFGDVADVAWWYIHKLPLREGLDRTGRLSELAGNFAGLTVEEGRRRIVAALEAGGLLSGRQEIPQSVRVHERCDTPVEYAVTRQWFIRVMDFKAKLLEAGAGVRWYPEHMQARYREWVENLDWDWCISRQRYFGVAFPLWYCEACGEILLADPSELPVDPRVQGPNRACACGSRDFRPETDIMDTWATSSMSPQIVGRWLTDPDLYAKVFPFSLRPQAHEIIRTWAFYTLVKSQHHFDILPWSDVAISGWGLAPEGMGKISKSRGGGPVSPVEMIERYSADAVRYWAASTGPGRDAIISEEKIHMGAKLVTKLWNVARFSQRFLAGAGPAPGASGDLPVLSPADRWILARTQGLIRRATAQFLRYDYAAAKQEVETFFWRDLADNYLEMAKVRLYGAPGDARAGAVYALRHAVGATLKLFAPFLPHVTDEIHRHLFAGADGSTSIHRSRWPEPDARFEDAAAERFGEILVEIATAVRRFKSEQSLPLGTEIPRLELVASEPDLSMRLKAATEDIKSVTRAQRVQVVPALDPGLERLNLSGTTRAALEPPGA
jgi:valyl-tRNA synthetase